MNCELFVVSRSLSFREVVKNGIEFDVSRSNIRNGVRNPRIVQNIIIQGALTHSCRHTNEIAKSNLSKNSIFYRIVIRLPPGDGKWKMKQTATPNRNSIAPLLEFAVINVRNCFLRQMPPHRLQNQLSIISCWKSVCVCVCGVFGCGRCNVQQTDCHSLNAVRKWVKCSRRQTTIPAKAFDDAVTTQESRISGERTKCAQNKMKIKLKYSFSSRPRE